MFRFELQYLDQTIIELAIDWSSITIAEPHLYYLNQAGKACFVLYPVYSVSDITGADENDGEGGAPRCASFTLTLWHSAGATLYAARRYAASTIDT